MSALDARTAEVGDAAGHRASMTEPALSEPSLGPMAETLHRLANNLAILSASIRMERRRVSDPAARVVLDGAVARIDAMAQVHRLIYGLPPEARIDLTAFLGHLAPVLGTSLGMGCGVGGAPVEVSGRTAEGLAVAMTELVLNAYKHGYGGAAGRGVEVGVARAPGGWVRLTVRDWGRGLAEAARPFEADGAKAGLDGTGLDGIALDGIVSDGAALDGPLGRPPLQGGLGLRLVGLAVETLGGRMSTVTDGGVHVVIEVPQG